MEVPWFVHSRLCKEHLACAQLFTVLSIATSIRFSVSFDEFRFAGLCKPLLLPFRMSTHSDSSSSGWEFRHSHPCQGLVSVFWIWAVLIGLWFWLVWICIFWSTYIIKHLSKCLISVIFVWYLLRTRDMFFYKVFFLLNLRVLWIWSLSKMSLKMIFLPFCSIFPYSSHYILQSWRFHFNKPHLFFHRLGSCH